MKIVDFKLVLEKLLFEFDEEDVRYALIGGFALGIWGVDRATVDIDFLLNREDLIKMNKIMSSIGYECVYQTENVTQFSSPLKIFGGVDFLHAFREASTSMLKRAEEIEIFSGALKIKVLKPEDIIGLKIQAMVNDESRKDGEILDIISLIKINRTTLDWSLIKQYFNIFELDLLGESLREKYYEIKK